VLVVLVEFVSQIRCLGEHLLRDSRDHSYFTVIIAVSKTYRRSKHFILK